MSGVEYRNWEEDGDNIKINCFTACTEVQQKQQISLRTIKS